MGFGKKASPWMTSQQSKWFGEFGKRVLGDVACV